MDDQDNAAVSLGQRLYELCQCLGTATTDFDTEAEPIFPWTGKSAAHRHWEWRARVFRDDILERERIASSDVALDALGLRATTRHPLHWASIDTVSDVVRFSDDELLALHGFGRKSLAELKAALGARGLSLTAPTGKA